jgi:hypothetical protein
VAITEARSLTSDRANKSANRHEKELKKKYQQPTPGGVDFQASVPKRDLPRKMSAGGDLATELLIGGGVGYISDSC